MLKKVVSILMIISILILNSGYSEALVTSISEIKGSNRYETAAKIADKMNYTNAILVNADNSLSDGLSSSGLAGAINAPILLTKKDSLPNPTLKKIDKAKNIYIIGGVNAISLNIEKNLKSKGKNIIRISGKTRIETSYNVAKEINKFSPVKKVMLVNGFKGEADAMSIASVAVRDKSPIILTNGSDLPFNLKNIESYVIGGSSIMNDKLVSATNSIRIGGLNRFDTNKNIINRFYPNTKDFYLSKAYNLVDALTASTIAKYAPIVLVSDGSNKSILNKATSLTALGGIDSVTLRQCIDEANGLNDIVYVTTNGKSYHSTKDCTVLKRSKKIISLKLSDAKKQGKSDPCNLCVK